MLKVILTIAVALTLYSAANAQESRFHSWTEACSTAERSVAEGDLIFLDIPVGLFRRVAAASHSWTSHVGIVFRDEFGQWIVADSAIPFSHEQPLCSFLKKSSEYTFEIRRPIPPLTAREVETMRISAKSRLNRLYDLGFNLDSRRMFCSKFVYQIYQSIGIEVGQVQTVRELFNMNPSPSMQRFWKFWFLGSIPFERRTITPASQLNDPKFVTVLRGH